MPAIGDYGLRILSPTVLELTVINTKDSITSPVPNWDFVSDTFALTLPPASSFTVTVNTQPVGITALGFRRRPIYAPVKQRDLRIGNYLYIQLASPIPAGTTVEVKNPSGGLWSAPTQFVAQNSDLRFSPAIHVNEVGYMPSAPKKAMVGYFLGSLVEMDIPTAAGFNIVRATDGAVVFSGALTQRADVGYAFPPLGDYPTKPYQKVYQADFSAFTTPGEYRLQVPGLGASYSFLINEGVAAAFARSFAIGMYHQRCGAELNLPFTRHEHAYCHTHLVQVPTMAEEFSFTQNTIADKTGDWNREPRHTAPRMTSTDTSLYPFVNQGNIDVSKGHHDAGDYSRYMINSAGVIHHLVFAADSFPGVGALDNMGIPESGDGMSDILQEAKWEADYVAKMQDADGGFYFLVYPKTREYENDVTPDNGDTQVVWPKTTSVTAAATAALAEIGSSPRFKQQFPTEAAAYLAKAQLGWTFLMNAIARNGKDGSYQKITHYGHEFMHDDELAWAASAMFAATGNPAYQAKLKEWMPDPNSGAIRRWDWWRMFEGWGCAIRTYAFAEKSGRLSGALLDQTYLTKCKNEVIATGDDIARFSQQTAYGMSFPDPSKGNQSAGWNFASERGFDLTVAYQLDPKPAYREAIFANINYEGGCNPVNVAFVTGIGWKRQRDIVQQQAMNDHLVLPPSGIPIGNIVKTFHGDLTFYKGELTRVTFPPDMVITGDQYAPYDRWGDSFNTAAEFVIVDVARSLGSLSFWMAQSAVASQPWKSTAGQITGLPATVPVGSSATIGFTAPGIDLTGAHVVWEVRYLEPNSGASLTFSPKYPGPTWIDVEAMLPDGRRIFARTNFSATTSPTAASNSFESAPVVAGANTAAIYHLDGALTDAAGRQGGLTLAGNALLDTSNLGWMTTRSGGAFRATDLGDTAKVSIPAASIIATGVSYVSVEAMIYINDWKGFNRGHAKVLSLFQNSTARLELREDKYEGPMIEGGDTFSYKGDAFKNALTLKTWHHVSLLLDSTGYTFRLNGTVVASKASGQLAAWAGNSTPVTLSFGDFEGWVDEVVVRSSTVKTIPNRPPTVTISAVPSVLTAPATVYVTAAATDSDGTIAKVEFFNGATRISEDTTAPYGYTLLNAAAGTYSFTARATDNSGATVTTAPVTVTVSPPTGSGTNTFRVGTFVKIDTTTKGNWVGAYGSQGYTIIGSGQLIPTYGGGAPTGKQNYTWSLSTTDARALQRVGGADRVMTVWYAPDAFNLDFNFTDNIPHRVALYLLDWDRTGRVQRFDILDPSNNAVLNSTNVSDFGEGKYLVFDLKGNSRVRISRVAGNNALIAGVFFDPAPQGKSGSLKLKGATAQGVQLEITGTTGEIYNIQSSTDMKMWGNVGQLNLTTSPMIYTDTTTAGHQGLRFYRVAP
ncbi:MAG TPA: glycoside hydrolase family 9 protein [Verrucomicrobiae bacterium]|nr:glycoside hydrolase family 9 protein [Verrucomicrobiae bacterium]